MIIESIRIRKRQLLRHGRRLSIHEQSRIINPGQKRKQKTLRYRKAKQKKNTINTTQANTRITCSPSDRSISNILLSLANNNNSKNIKYGSGSGHNDDDEGNDEKREIIILPPKKRLMTN